MGGNLVQIGIHTAEILVSSNDITLNIDRAGRYLFEKLQCYTDRIRIYISDDNGENLLEAVICTEKGIQQGKDMWPYYQLPSTLTKEGHLTWIFDNMAAYLMMPLRHKNKLIGLIELRAGNGVESDVIQEFVHLADAVSLGLNHAQLLQKSFMEKQYFDATLKIINSLQTISNVDELLSSFVTLSAEYLKFDRVSVFIYDSQGKNIINHRCANINGKVGFLKEIPEVPQLDKFPEPLKYIAGYWVPLRTSTGLIGAALFDNIYSLYRIPQRLVEILVPLCNQFALVYENIRMFTATRHNAQHDGLTGIYNRAFFEEELKRLDTFRQLPLSIVMGDLNGLKIVNDVFGHIEGDNILRAAADNITKACRSEDIIARWGGDEFIILLPKTPEKAVDEVCNRIRSLFSEYSDAKVQLSISLGHATKTNEDEDIQNIIKYAEDRMYRHKLMESRSFRSSFISSLKETLFEKCQETTEHIERMEKLSVVIGTAMGLPDNELDDLKLLAMVHDVGKVAISNSILNKPGKLTKEEWEEMKLHSEIGYRIAQSSSELSQIADYILCHHEKWDGSGYPIGKVGTEIPELARIISIIDAYDVMTHVRSYKTAMSSKDAMDELLRCSGTQFDPAIVDIFIKLFSIYNEIA
jgi:diguanylate cyclase (GGDEF)-like protein